MENVFAKNSTGQNVFLIILLIIVTLGTFTTDSMNVSLVKYWSLHL